MNDAHSSSWVQNEAGIALYPLPLKRRGFSAMMFGKE
jgi:hypothetical protein